MRPYASRVPIRRAVPEPPFVRKGISRTCGYLGSAIRTCTCGTTAIGNYRSRLSGPLVDLEERINEAMDRPDPGRRAPPRLVVGDDGWGDAHMGGKVRLGDPKFLAPLPHRLARLVRQGDFPRDFLAEWELHGEATHGGLYKRVEDAIGA